MLSLVCPFGSRINPTVDLILPPNRLHSRNMKTLLTIVALVFASNLGLASDWPQFRGANSSGVSMDTGLPVEWNPGTNLRWKAELPGRGVSSPIVAAGRAYVTAATGYQQDRLHVLCFEVATGKPLWHRQMSATGNTLCHPKTSTAAATPVSDGDRVYALFATGDLVCFDRDGNLIWYRSLEHDYPTISNNVGMASSPILWNDELILVMETAGDSFAAAIDKNTGKNRWKIERNRDINWVTPLMLVQGASAEVLFQSAPEISAYDARTGKKRWSFESKGLATIPSPITAHGILYLPASGQVLAVQPGSEQMPAKQLWQSNKLKTSYGSPLFYEDRIYTISNPVGIVACVAADGTFLWQSERLNGQFSASPVAGDGKLYFVNEEGTTTVMQSGPAPKILATNRLEETVMATPAIADGALFIRSEKHLFCVANPKK